MKQAFFWPNAARSLELLSKYLPPALLVGGGAAGVQHLLAMKAEQEKNELDTSGKDVLTVQVPTSKLAGMIDNLLRATRRAGPVVEAEVVPASRASGAAPALSEAERAVGSSAQSSYAARKAGRGDPNSVFGSAPATPPTAPASAPPHVPASGGGGAGTGAPTAAAGGAAAPPPGGGGLAAAAAGGPPGQPPWYKNHWKALTGALGLTTTAAAVGGAMEHGAVGESAAPSLADASIATALVGGGLIGGYSLVNHLIKNRRRKAMEEQLDQAKGEYSRLLGQTLAKNAGVDAAVEFPFIHGLCSGLVDSSGAMNKEASTSSGMMLLGIPGALAVLSGIAAHRWMYNRQKEVESMYVNKKPEPPKQIRLVSTPPPDSQFDDDQPLALGASEPEKVAGLAELLDFVKSPGAAEAEKEEEKDKQPRATRVAPGTVQISTPGGTSTEIEATDPATAHILAKNTQRLTKLIAAYQSTPAMAA